ncbi:MAG: hypothetical protein IKP74_08335 [Clostridia bacterium]|nr:hypothetical protein [Clostridia bacterium]
MKDLDFYKAEVLKRIDAKRETVREKRRSALSLAYPLALLFTCLLFFFPGIRTVGPDRLIPSTDYIEENPHDSMTVNHGSSGIPLPSTEQFFRVSETLLGEKIDPGFDGSSHLTDSAAHMYSQPQFNQIGGSETDALRYGEAVRFDLAGGVPESPERSKDRYGVGTLPLHRAFLRTPAAVLVTREFSLFRWQTGEGAYLFVTPAEKSGKVAFLFPILCEVISDAKPIPRRLTEETLAALPPTEEEA